MTTGRSIEEAQLECVDTGSKTSVECALIDDWCCYCCMCRLGNSKPQSPLFVVQLATLDAVSCLTVCALLNMSTATRQNRVLRSSCVFLYITTVHNNIFSFLFWLPNLFFVSKILPCSGPSQWAPGVFRAKAPALAACPRPGRLGLYGCGVLLPPFQLVAGWTTTQSWRIMCTQLLLLFAQ